MKKAFVFNNKSKISFLKFLIYCLIHTVIVKRNKEIKKGEKCVTCVFIFYVLYWQDRVSALSEPKLKEKYNEL